MIDLYKYICFFFTRRKPGRNTNQTKQGLSTIEAHIADNEQRYSSKSIISKKHSIPSQKQTHRSADSTHDELPPAVPPRQPLEKKNSVHMQSAILNPSVLSHSSMQISSNTTDDTLSQSSLAPARILPSKEVRRRRRVSYTQSLNSLFPLSRNYTIIFFVLSSFRIYRHSLFSLFDSKHRSHLYTPRQINTFTLSLSFFILSILCD